MKNNFVKAILIALVLLICFLSLPWLFMYIGLKTSANPPEPKIKYGEFPFTLKYELEGKLIEINDTLICEYDGVQIDEGSGKTRRWKEKFKSDSEKIVLLKISDTNIIYYPVGGAKYYMGDEENSGEIMPLFPDAIIVTGVGILAS